MTKRERILALADGTRTAKEIAAEVGCHPVYVLVAMRRAGVAGRLKHSGTTTPQPHRNRAIMALMKTGATYDEIGAQFGITKQRVQQIISRGID